MLRYVFLSIFYDKVQTLTGGWVAWLDHGTCALWDGVQLVWWLDGSGTNSRLKNWKQQRRREGRMMVDSSPSTLAGGEEG